jgi:hypothetical protein
MHPTFYYEQVKKFFASAHVCMALHADYASIRRIVLTVILSPSRRFSIHISVRSLSNFIRSQVQQQIIDSEKEHT